jgi:DNA-binding SARP family transcriptional activator
LTLLACLLLHPNRVVSTDALVGALWGDEPVETAVTQVHGLVSALRRHLARSTAGSAARDVIVTRPPGYVLQVEPGQLDIDAMEQLAHEASQALTAGLAGEGSALLHRALALWRGPALGGAAGAVVEAAAARLEERRLALLEQRVETDLALGRHAALVPELTAVVAEHPLRERLLGQLMIALHGSGRQAEALSIYREARRDRIERFGLDPGAELQRLERAILQTDPALGSPAQSVTADGSSVAGAAPAAVVPAQLPADVRDFTGRDEKVTAICDLLGGTDEAGHPPAVAISVVSGRAGVGKTTLAVHVAHRLRASFPDGQLYANLSGTRPAPADPAYVLGRFLQALGVHGAAMPERLEERAELYRSRLAGRRMLVLLDNAAGERQVRPLLPGCGQCAVIVTSRARLAALEGSSSIDLDALAPNRSLELLGRIAGPERVAAEPDAAGLIVSLCGHLPLAVRVAGARLAARPHWRLLALAERLTDQRRQLAELLVSAGELAEARSCLGESLRIFETLRLPMWCARTLRALADVHDHAGDPAAAAESRMAARRLLSEAGLGEDAR